MPLILCSYATIDKLNEHFLMFKYLPNEYGGVCFGVPQR